MNVALIIAGGSGKRTNQDIPKQFLNVMDKPIVVYTLETFQKHPEIQGIAVVCLEGWEHVLEAYAKQFGIAKLQWIVKGGASGQESIRNGLEALEKELSPEDVVLIHDGIRPMVDPSIITDCIAKCKEYGNGITSLPITEQIFEKDTEETTTKVIPREKLKILQTPQAYRYETILSRYREGFEKEIGIGPSDYANTLMVKLGETLYFAKGSSNNIKITTKEDIETFKAMLTVNKATWLK
ncbi:MAG: 2-C-methyl-D-erythritol 4-phosphate cytidylyltransferase [Lachnospiraceae bacterium]|nr:2-C-methyl-D-erythritol 4-phosphate cytidylyltransferase [Lachnospiraceae bacterium]